LNSSFTKEDGVLVSAGARRKFAAFEEIYLSLREKENRIYAVEKLRKLPCVDRADPDYRVWRIRQKSLARLLKYLSGKGRALRVLDVGCGNGFISHRLATEGHLVTAIDVNLVELKLAARAFGEESVRWLCADIFEDDPGKNFDAVCFSSSIQYFLDLDAVINRSLSLLNEAGEIHIIDSPFYSEEEVDRAQRDSVKYFVAKGVAEFAPHYGHHRRSALDPYRPLVKYRPVSRFGRLFIKDSPFHWFIIPKPGVPGH
jgi:2-polyprenyl-3-methyl-5-hydroxy-6-metoxy-1,4-benzoquinol methylase